MGQSNTWHRGAPPSHRLKHDSARDIAALSKRLMEVMEEIDSLPNPKAKGSPLERERKRVAERTADG